MTPSHRFLLIAFVAALIAPAAAQSATHMPVGFFEHAPYADQSEQLRHGDVLVVYSDGVTEALDVQGQEFGEERLVKILQERHNDDATAILDAIISEVKTFSHGAPQHDDVTAMTVKFVG